MARPSPPSISPARLLERCPHPMCVIERMFESDRAFAVDSNHQHDASDVGIGADLTHQGTSSNDQPRLGSLPGKQLAEQAAARCAGLSLAVDTLTGVAITSLVAAELSVELDTVQDARRRLDARACRITSALTSRATTAPSTPANSTSPGTKANPPCTHQATHPDPVQTRGCTPGPRRRLA
jgi:hypothetical protein